MTGTIKQRSEGSYSLIKGGMKPRS